MPIVRQIKRWHDIANIIANNKNFDNEGYRAWTEINGNVYKWIAIKYQITLHLLFILACSSSQLYSQLTY